MASGDWEVVGKSRRKNENDVSKKQSKKLFPRSATIFRPDPLLTESTIYAEAFYPKPKQSKEKIVANGHERAKPIVKPIVKPVKQPIKKHLERKKKAMKISSAIKELDVAKLEKTLLADQKLFPNNPSVWLQDIASVISSVLKDSPDDGAYLDEHNYPSCLLACSSRAFIDRLLSVCPLDSQELFVFYYFSDVCEASKDLSKHGEKMVLQLIARNHPQLILQPELIQKQREVLCTHQAQVLRCRMILWGISQAALSSLDTAVKVWFDFFLPTLNNRSLAPSVIVYLQQFFKAFSSEIEESPALSVKQYFTFVDMIFLSEGSLSNDHQRVLRSFYPRIKKLAFGKSPSNRLHDFFPTFLARLSSSGTSANPTYDREISERLLACLVEDASCFAQWRHMLDSHLEQSSALLWKLVKHWGDVRKKISPSELRLTGSHIKSVQQKALGSGESPPKALASCLEALSLLEDREVHKPSRFYLVPVVITLTVATFTATCLYFCDCAFTTLLCQKLTEVFTSVLKFLELNLPVYYAKVAAFCGPYLLLARDQLVQLCLYLWTLSEPCRDWLNRSIPVLLENIHVHSVVLFSHGTTLLQRFAVAVEPYGAVVWEAIGNTRQQIIAWAGRLSVASS